MREELIERNVVTVVRPPSVEHVEVQPGRLTTSLACAPSEMTRPGSDEGMPETVRRCGDGRVEGYGGPARILNSHIHQRHSETMRPRPRLVGAADSYEEA